MMFGLDTHNARTVVPEPLNAVPAENPNPGPLGFEDAIGQARARYAATTPTSRLVGASKATRWLNTLMGGSGTQGRASDDAAPRL